MNCGKCLEYYFDSKTFTKEKLIESIEDAKTEFPNMEVKPNLFLNQWGVYILKLEFTNKNQYLATMKTKRKDKKVLSITEKNRKISQKKTAFLNRSYGEYKKTNEYRPI